MIQKICVAGAGTMGSGIAMAAAQYHKSVILFDTNESVLNKARISIAANLQTLADKGKMTLEEKDAILGRIQFTDAVKDCVAPLIIEAIIEQMDAKLSLFGQLATINHKEAIFASNTSSLSIASIQANVQHPGRVAGLHFFNPAQIMKLVEVVKAPQTADHVVQELMSFCSDLKKTPVLCKDAPGFIVNRVARHYYLEAMKLVEQHVATIESVDAVMEASGFKMGPFKLMDLIGMDINLAVSASLYEAFDKAPRFEPSAIQIAKVAQGKLGRKSGSGFYEYNK